MKKIAIAFLSILVIFSRQTPTIAFPKTFSLDVSNTCQSAIDSSLEKLKKARAYEPYIWAGNQLINPQYGFLDYREQYVNVPHNKPYGLVIGMSGPAVEKKGSLSSRLTQSIATEVIRNCENISAVEFVNFTSANIFGLVNDSVVIFPSYVGQEECEFPIDKIKWGTSCVP